MQIRNVAYSTLAATVLSVAVMGTASAVPIINFDQDAASPTGSVSYDGSGGALNGRNISFDFISATGTPDGAIPNLTCSGCMLNFTTGANISEGPTQWTFGSGGTFTLTGTAINEAGEEIASGTLADGTFVGESVARQQNVDPTTPPATLSISSNGSDSKPDALVQYFGLDPDSAFVFSNTIISLQETTFGADNSFRGNVTAADLNNTNVAMPTTPPMSTVPEPEELAMFGFGTVLLVGGLAFRRRGGAAFMG